MFTNNVNTEVQAISKFQSTRSQRTYSSEIAIDRLAKTLNSQSDKVAYLLELIRTIYIHEAQYKNEKKLIQKTASTLNISPQLLKDIECWVFLHNNSSRKSIKH